jgi:propanol-preferring alcohol dehydrogenase
MRAMVLTRPAPIEENPLQLQELPKPTPGRGQLLLRVLTCGVCHTDLHTVEGDLELRRLPVIPGHQIVAVVDSAGDATSRFAPGTRVGVPWLHQTCQTCSQCAAGRENLCDSAQFTGFHADGGYAEWLVAPEAFVHPLPEGISDEHAAPLLCAGVIGLRALQRSGLQPGGRLGLWGFGASAHVVIQIARHQGCEVCVVTRNADHQAHARELGAAWVGSPGEKPPRPLDAAVNFTPAGGTVPEGLRALRRGGTLALAGIHMSPLPEIPYETLWGERTLTSVANSTRQDVRDLLRLAAEIPLHTEVDVQPLEDANGALLRMKRSEIRGAAVLRVGEL